MRASWSSKSQGGVLEVARTANANAQGQEEAWRLQRRQENRASKEQARETSARWTEVKSTGQKHVNCIPRAVGSSLGFFFFSLVRNDTI